MTTKLKTAVTTIVTGIVLLCTGTNSVKADVVYHYVDVDGDEGTLNDIRFVGFSDDDWLDNEYIRALRRHINAFREGRISDDELSLYRNDVKGKFVIANVEPFLLGGLFIQIVFIDKPENVFSAWVYSEVNEKTRTVTRYSVRRVSLDSQKNTLTREEILKEVRLRPEIKLW